MINLQQQKGIVFEIDLMIIRKQCIVFIRLRGRNFCPFLNWLQIYNVALNTINLLQNIQQPLSLLEAGNTWQRSPLFIMATVLVTKDCPPAFNHGLQ